MILCKESRKGMRSCMLPVLQEKRLVQNVCWEVCALMVEKVDQNKIVEELT